MSPLVHFLLVAAVLHAACAASLPKLLSDITLEPEDTLDKDAAPEVVAVDQASIIKDIENNLRVKPEDIPVEVIIEDSQPAIKTNEVADDENDAEIKRPSIDLRNPGPPQRQEHETQNADHFTDVKISSVQETILQTQDLLRQGVKGVGDDISNWLSTNEQMNAIQENIQSLRDSFTLQIQKLNEIIKGLAAPQALKPEETAEQVQTQPNFKEVETRIKILENNFNNGVRALSEGVNIVSILRAEDESTEPAGHAPTPVQPEPTQAPGSTPTTSPPSQNILFQFMNNFQNVMADSMRNVTTAISNAVNNVPGVSNIQNFWNPTSTLPPGVQADTPDGTTQRPTNNPWPIWQPFQNLFNGPGQGQSEQGQTPTTPGPIVAGFQNLQTAFQNNPFVQNVIGFVRPGASSPNATGSNVVPQKPIDEKQPETPATAGAAPPAPTASTAPAAPVGPIRQILSNSPVVQGIAGTVQRIQSSLNNPETPRDTEKSDELETKGGFYGGGGGNNNRPSDYGSNNDVSSGLKPNADPIKEDIISDEMKNSEVEGQKISDVVLEKTE